MFKDLNIKEEVFFKVRNNLTKQMIKYETIKDALEHNYKCENNIDLEVEAQLKELNEIMEIYSALWDLIDKEITFDKDLEDE